MSEHLTTGWEAEVPAADSLLRAFVLSISDRGEALAAAAGGRTQRSDAAAFADGQAPLPFDNPVTLLEPTTGTGPREVVAEPVASTRPSDPSSSSPPGRSPKRATSASA
jgi:hypothetical protein